MLICHSCGTPVESKSKQCHHCRSAVSAHAAVGLLEPETSNPLKVRLELQPKTLDNLIANDLIKAVSSRRSSLISPSSPPVQENGGNGGHDSNPATSKNLPAADKPGNGKEDKQEKGIDFFARVPEVFRQNPSDDTENVKKGFDWQSAEEASGMAATEAPANKWTADRAEEATVGSAKSNPNNNINNPDSKLSGKINLSLPESFPINTENKGEKETAVLPPSTNTDGNGAKGIADQPAAPSEPAPAEGFAKTVTSEQNNQSAETAANTANRRSFTALQENKAFNFNLKSYWPQILAIGLVAVFLLFKGFETLCAAGNALSAVNSGNVATVTPTNSISGRWRFVARWTNGGCQGEMVIHQRDKEIFGEGIDNNRSQYKFSGSRTGDHIDLIKQYFISTGFTGPTIQMQGDLDADSKPLFMHGEFKIDYMQGGKWRGKPVVINGIWEAEMTQPLIEEENPAVGMQYIPKSGQTSSSFGTFGNNLAKYGIWVVVAMVILGWGAWHTMSSLIGPDGWFGIWDKQKYVPPQFMSDHKKEKRQLSRPLTTGSLPLGERWEWKSWQKYFPWIPKDLALPPDVRTNNPHVLILGGGEKGKSRLMANMIAHDIDSADRAVVVVDSDGDLADFLLRWVSAHPNGQEIAKRVIVIDPTGNAPSPSFNPLELWEDADMQNAASAIVHGFKAIYHEPPGSQNQWSPQTAHILRNSTMLLMANGKTLIDLPTLLQDNDFRDIMLEKIEQRKAEKVEFATLLETWGQYKRLARTEQWINWYEPILNRVGPTLINLRIRPILTQAKGDINLKNVITDKKILIVKIPKGQLHDDANLLGSLIVTGLKQAAITLCTEGKISDRIAALYLDEFDNFIEKETLDAITTETKKFQLGFIGSTKTLQHMPEDFRNQIVINIGTMCVFALSKKDGDMIGPQMFRVSGRKAKHRTLMNLLNKVNTSPQFELISDEEKYNIDRILGQTERNFYAYRVGTVAGIFRMKCHDFNDVPDNKVNTPLMELMYKNR